MIIGVDAGCLGVSDERLKVGVYQVACNLFKELAKIDRINEYRLFSFYPIEKKIMACFGRRVRNIVLRPKTGWFKARLPLELKIHPVDVFLGLSQALPHSMSHNILLVYDLAFERFPEAYPDSCKKLAKNTREAAGLADKILAVSLATKKDLMKLYQVPEEKITVLYPGVGENFKPQGRKKNFGRPYFLYAGALKKIKNIPSIIAGFAYFLKKERKDYLLVLVGGNFWFDREIERIIKIYNLEKNVILEGVVEEKALPGYYRGATGFVSPSLYEGCGLTLLEAMASGLPVITANVSAMPEVVKDSGILVDPLNTREIGEAMRRIIGDQRLRDRLVKAGLKRGKYFTWQKFSQKIYHLL